ncbi:prepilin signal peptidase PulO-like enzyme (type II secretory pathway) [Marinobacterium sp. MBR-111]|uniref:potassium channel family protein n=1 Tax=Marinobacterium sp. MBR-111 TaxID=3156463 RepID=UPI003395C30A
MKKELLQLSTYTDVLVCIGVMLTLLFLVRITPLIGISALIGMFLLLIGLATFSSVRFFKSDSKFEALYFYVVSLGFMITMFAVIYKSFNICCDLNGEVLDTGWYDAFYFSVVTWTTLGYGDFKPTNDLKIFAMAEALMGQIFMALLAGKVMFWLQKLDKGEKETAS